MRIAIITDAWSPQVNGVVRTLQTTCARLTLRGHTVLAITPADFRTVPCPSYPEIRLALGCGRGMASRLAAFAPDAIHIATEGPLGWAARRWCIGEGHGFTTSFHTRFPDYVALRTRLPADWFWSPIRRFHAAAARVMVSTPTLAEELRTRRITHTHLWSRGVDIELFTPDAPPLTQLASLPRPIQLYLGRVAVEKNIAAFLDTTGAGTKVVVGDGPARDELAARYPQALFVGALHGAALASAYVSADVLVFPSLTDTFGLVMIEALAVGTPVAAYPVPGPLDVIGGAVSGPDPIGALDADLGTAIARALRAERSTCAAFARRYSWDACTAQFLAGLEVTDRGSAAKTAVIAA